MLFTIFITIACARGLGDHISTISKERKPQILKPQFFAVFFSLLALAFSKAAFAVTLLRLAAARWQTYTLWFIIVSVNIILILDALVAFIGCSPVVKRWSMDTPGTCWDEEAVKVYSVFAGSYSVTMDAVLAILPAIMIRNLNIDMKEKIGVSILMGLGVFAGVTGAIKVSYLPDVGAWKDPTCTYYPTSFPETAH